MKERQLADLARTILRDPTVRVTFGGNTSYFTHETDRLGNKTVLINIAKMEATPQGVLLMCGLVFHEIGHRNTDGNRSPGMLGDMENLVEDVRTEALTIKERPGASFDLEAVTEHYWTKGVLEPQDIAHAVRGKAMAFGRSHILGQKAILPLEETCNEMMEDAFGQSFVEEVEAILQGYSTLKNTDDSRAMAKALIDLLVQQQQQNQQQNQQQSQPQSEQQEQGDGSGGQDQGDDEPQGQDNQSQEDEDQDSTGQNQQQGDGQGEEQDDQQQDAQGDSGNGGQDSQSGQDGEPGADPDSEDSSNNSQDTGGNLGAGAGGQGSKRPTPEEIEEMLANQTGYGDFGQLMQDELDELAAQSFADGDSYSETPEWPELGRLTRKYTPLDETETMAASSRMRTRLGSLLFSSKRLPVTHGTSGRKLNTNRLVRMMTAGDPKIFQKKVEEAAPNSVVVIAIDTSGSMVTENRWVIASQASFALNSCLHSLPGVKCATVEFSSKDRNDGSWADVNIVCDFGQKPKSDAFNIPPFSGTPTDQAIWVARGMLLQRPEPRKILLVVTDGAPNDPGLTRGATKRTLKDGIEIAAIGIQESGVKDYWKNNRVIQSISDLPTAMFGMLEEMLTRRPGGAA